MSKKQLAIYIIAGMFAIYLIHLYRAYHPTTLQKPPQVAAPKPVPAEAPHLQTEAAGAANQNAAKQDLIKQYTAKIDAAKGNDAEDLFQRAVVYQSMEQYRMAIEDFTSALKIIPNSPFALYNRAMCYQKLQENDKALADISAALKLKPDFAQAYNLRATINANSDDIKNAMNDYDNAIKIDPNYDDAYFNLGVLYEQQKQYKEAQDAFTKAINANKLPPNATPDDAAHSKQRMLEAYMHRSVVEMIMPDLKTAMDDVNYVITNDPKNVAALRLRAEIYKRMGNQAASTADTAAADTLSMQNMLQQNSTQ